MNVTRKNDHSSSVNTKIGTELKLLSNVMCFGINLKQILRYYLLW